MTEKYRPELVSGSVINNNYGGYRQVVKTTDCGSVMRGFESHYPPIKNTVTFVTVFFILYD